MELLDTPHFLTVEEYMTLNIGARTELLGGVIYDVSPRNEPHRYAVTKLNQFLSRGLGLEYVVQVQDAVAVAGWRGKDAPRNRRGYSRRQNVPSGIEDRGSASVGRNDAPILHAHDAIAERGRFRRVRRHQDRLTSRREFTQQSQHARPTLRIEIARGFVGEHDRRIVDRRARDCRTLHLAAGRLATDTHRSFRRCRPIRARHARASRSRFVRNERESAAAPRSRRSSSRVIN